jgi:hypothetical protein
MFEIMLKFRRRMKQPTPQLKRVTERVRIAYHEFGEGYRNALNTCNNKGRFCNTRCSEWPYSLSEFLDLAEKWLYLLLLRLNPSIQGSKAYFQSLTKMISIHATPKTASMRIMDFELNLRKGR